MNYVFILQNSVIITFVAVGADCEVRSWEDNNKSSTWVGWENECISDSLGGTDTVNEMGASAGCE